MKTTLSIPRLALVLLIVACLIVPVTPASAEVQTLVLAPGCAFGYTLVSGPSWTEIQSTGTRLFNSPELLPDDLLSPAMGLGFSFAFFEKTYSSVTVSTNGFLIFGNSGDNAFPNNYAIPAEYPPNNVVAGFWDDLTVGGFFNGGAAYFQAGDPSNPAIIEWKEVTRLGKSDTLSFEILLYPNGDIAFVYGAMNGDLNRAAVGIEDSDGVDGCQLLYHAAGLGSGQTYKLAFPPAGSRVKAVPSYLGGFLARGKVDLPFSVVNTGTGADTFSFQVSGSGGWNLAVVNGQGQVVSATSSLVAGGTYQASLRVTAPAGATTGATFQGQMDVVSQTTPAKKFSVRFDAAIPALFTAFYVDSSTAYLRYVMPDRQVVAQAFPGFSGRTLGLTSIAAFDYLIDWEYLPPSTRVYGNIMKAVETPWSVKSPVDALFDHDGEPDIVYDQNAAAIVAPNGKTGVTFVRYYSGLGSRIYFAGLDANGQLLTAAVELPGQTVPVYSYTNPKISATPDNHFVIVYEKSGGVKDIGMVVIDDNGVPVTTPPQPQVITDSQTTHYSYFAPASASMLNGKTFIAYLSQSGAGVTQLDYRVRNADGSLDPAQTIPNVDGTPGAVVLKDGTILLAWLKTGTPGIEYALFDKATGANIPPTVRDLSPVNGQTIEYVSLSLTGDLSGNAVITWTDQAGCYLYYALIGPDGSIITPPMAFLRASNPTTPNLIFSSTGRGVAPLKNFWSSYLPVMSR